MKKVGKYFWNLLIAIDQLVNTIFGGDPDETISSRTGKLRHKRMWARCLTDFLNIFEKNHTAKSIEEDEGDDRTME